MSATNHCEDLALDWLFTTDSVTRPTAWYIATHLDDPGETGASNETTTSEDADYARQSITFASASSGQSLNDLAASWTVNSGSSGYTVKYASIWDAATSGNCLAYGALQANRVLAASDVLTFAVGEVVIALD